MLKFDERFARQYRYEPPSEFPLTSPYSGIVHHLSGPNRYAHTQTSLRRSKSVVCAKQKNPNCYFHYAYRFATHTLAHMLDSLVRVSRRVEKNHLVNVLERKHFFQGCASNTLGVLQRSHPDFQPSHAFLNRGKDRNPDIRNTAANQHVPSTFLRAHNLH